MQAQPAGRTSPHLCAAIWRRRLLWAVICLVWAVTCMRGTPRRRRGRACGFNPPTCAACEVPMGSDASYNERRLLWAAVRFVQAVTGVRANQPAFMPRLASTAGAEDSMGCGTLCASGILHEKTPAPRGRELYAGSACRAGQPAFMPRLANTAGAGVSMGSDALRLGCNLHEGNPARQGGRGCRLSLPGQPAFMRAYRIRGARGFLLGSDALCMGCISHMDSPAR